MFAKEESESDVLMDNLRWGGYGKWGSERNKLRTKADGQHLSLALQVSVYSASVRSEPHYWYGV